MQFELISEHNNWTASVKAIELLTALKDDAMVYASFLPSDVKSSFSSLCAAMVSRFGDHGYPETYTQELHTLKKLSRETIQEYAFRVEMLVRKSFPTIDTATHGTLSVEYMLRGLPDQSISLELLTKRISSMTEAIRQIVLYETYKRGTRERHNIRQLNTEEPPFVTGNDTEDVEIRKVGGKRFVTEEQLAQFQRDIQDSITKSVGEAIQTEMKKSNRRSDDNGSRQNRTPFTAGRDNRQKMKSYRCFICNSEDHYRKDCPNAKMFPRTHTHNDSQARNIYNAKETQSLN
jgi:hypothetical protein